MYVDRIEVVFDAGHRLLAYPGKCAAPHGHTYRAEVFVAGNCLDELGLVIDFGALKTRVKGWIDQNWDHGFLLNDADSALIAAFRAIPESKVYLFQAINPSAEAMAKELFVTVHDWFGGIVQGVRIWESPLQYAEYIPWEGSILRMAERAGQE